MSTWNIYHKDGSLLTDANGEQVVIHGLEYSDSWMSECYVTVTFEHNCPIEFSIGDYIEYRGERFELNYDPGKIKDASKDSYGQAFKYDGVKFNALQDELGRTEMLDVVLGDNGIHYTALPKFSFYVECIDDLLDRIQANLNEQIGEGQWKLFSRSLSRSLQRGCTKEEWLSAYGSTSIADNEIDSKSVTIDTQTCWEALALVNSEWDINFIVRGRNIYVGTAGVPTANIFKYGRGNGLYEIEQNADTEQSVTTRLRAYGSEKNLPDHYYADLGCEVYATAVEKEITPSGLVVTIDTNLSWTIAYKIFTKTWVVDGMTNAYQVKVKIGDVEAIASAFASISETEGAKGNTRIAIKKDYGNEASVVAAFYNAALSERIYFTYGVNKTNWPSGKKDYAVSNVLPNNMAIGRLMLPGFPSQSLQDYWDALSDEDKAYCNPGGKEHKFSTDPYRPYIDSLNIDTIGLRSASQFFDTDDKTNGIVEIYPTMEEMVIGGVRVDEINEGVAPDDDGRFDDGQTVPNVDIYLSPYIDFDITGLKESDFAISMKDGMCGGREFTVSATNKVDGRWRLTINRVKDDALDLYFPYKDYPISKGDHFVLTGIYLPDSYVKAASLKLLKYAIAYLDKNDYTRYVYQPKVDEIFMARQHDAALADTTGVTKSLHDTLKAGDIMLFKDTDLAIDAQISIDQLSIKEEDGKIPTYEITLREDKEVGTIQKIQQQISSLESGNGGSGGSGITASQVKNLIAAEGAEYFLSKRDDDTAKGHITFEKGVDVTGDVCITDGNLDVTNGDMAVSGVGQFGDDVNIDGNLSVLGNANIANDTTTKNLTVTGQAHFFELVIDKIKAAGGTVLFSAANSFNVEKAVTSDDGATVRLYWLAESGTTGSMNTWEVGDQAVSMDFNRATVGTTYEASNKYWWALVTATSGNSPETLTEDDGTTHRYHWIDISTTDKAEGCTVVCEQGDAVAQWGSRSSDKKRQAAIMIAAYKSPDAGVEAPCFVEYTGINSFTLTDANRKNKIAYDGTVLKGNFTAVSTASGERDIAEWLDSLQETASAHFDIWYGEGAPTMENLPASSWTSDGQKGDHVGDLYFDRTDTASSSGGHCYRFTATTADDVTTYAWEDYTDHDTLKALTKAQNIADDGVITAGAEKMQLLITRDAMKREFGTFHEPTSESTEYYLAYNLLKMTYDNFMAATDDIVSDANINVDTNLSDIGLTASEFVEYYYNYHAALRYAETVRNDNIEASISTLDGKVALAVTKDGLKTAGIDVTDGRVVIDAAKTTVTGDLTVQGAITDSTSYVWTDGTLWSPNDVGELEQSDDNLLVSAGNTLFVPIDMTAVKSVQIQTTDPSEITDGQPTTMTPGLVTLPMYDAVDLGCGVTMPAYRRSGTRVLVRNAFSLAFTQWAKSADGWADTSLDTNFRQKIAQSAVYICTDPRLLSLSNYTGATPVITADGRDVDGQFATAEWFKGCMYLNGRRGRWLVLLPGQEVELTSVITMWKTGTNTPVPYLAWYVSGGGGGMDWLKKNISIQPDGDGYTEYNGTFVSDITGGESMGVGDASKYADALFGSKQLSDDYATGVPTQTMQIMLGAGIKPYITIG